MKLNLIIVETEEADGKEWNVWSRWRGEAMVLGANSEEKSTKEFIEEAKRASFLYYREF